MYVLYELSEWVGVPPSALTSGDLKATILRILRESLEGTVDPEIGIIIAVIDAEVRGEGVILPISGDPKVYYNVKYKVLAYEPVLLEVIRGVVRDAREHGIFVSLGPIDGFVYKTQIMDEPVEYLPDRKGFRGSQSGRVIEVKDVVRARITQISKPSRRAKTIRIGMTMRQPYLGKEEWVREMIVKRKG